MLKVQYKAIVFQLKYIFFASTTLQCSCIADEILLDPDDRPLELAVNSRSPVTFHLVTGGDRNTELLKTLRNENFTPEQRRKLIEK